MPMRAVAEAHALQDRGLEGDRAAGRSHGKRQITLVQAGHLDIIAAFLGKSRIPPELLRRNIVVSGVDLLDVKRRLVSIGEAVVEVHGYCAPCRRVEETLGPGGREAMAGHGGVAAIVRTGGMIRLGDPVDVLSERQHALVFE
jgi:MOSC domain-containing protein YiiM